MPSPIANLPSRWLVVLLLPTLLLLAPQSRAVGVNDAAIVSLLDEPRASGGEQPDPLEKRLVELPEESASRIGPAAAAAPGEVRRQPSLPARAAPAAEESDWWIELGALFALIAGLIGLIRRQAEMSSRQAELPVCTEPLIDANEDSGWELLPFGSADDPTQLPDREKAADRFSTFRETPDAPPQGEQSEVAVVLELAEVMLAFGRIKGAEQALEEFVENQPGAALTPWLKLLEIYRQNGQRDAFEGKSEQLRRHFNVATAAWEVAGEAGVPAVSASEESAAAIEELLPRLPMIGQLPHITTEISRAWGSPGCLAYLNRLLRDNRNGQRGGFAMATVRELLFLTDVLESSLARTR